MAETTHYCTYCDYYAHSLAAAGRASGRGVYTGSRNQVVKHAFAHPIGDPHDMAVLITDADGLWRPARVGVTALAGHTPGVEYAVVRDTETVRAVQYRDDDDRPVRYATAIGAARAANKLNRDGVWA